MFPPKERLFKRLIHSWGNSIIIKNLVTFHKSALQRLDEFWSNICKAVSKDFWYNFKLEIGHYNRSKIFNVYCFLDFGNESNNWWIHIREDPIRVKELHHGSHHLRFDDFPIVWKKKQPKPSGPGIASELELNTATLISYSKDLAVSILLSRSVTSWGIISLTNELLVQLLSDGYRLEK